MFQTSSTRAAPCANDQIVLPYAICDTFSNFSMIKIADLLTR